jgi:predicted aconitase with swiveling domain
VAGQGAGPLLRLRAPISFWGGVDPVAGTVADPRHPDHGRRIGGSVLWVPATVGSSSSSAILLELLRERTAPAAILLGRADAILALGAVVGRELGYAPIPILELAPDALEGVEEGTPVRVDGAGRVTFGPIAFGPVAFDALTSPRHSPHD